MTPSHSFGFLSNRGTDLQYFVQMRLTVGRWGARKKAWQSMMCSCFGCAAHPKDLSRFKHDSFRLQSLTLTLQYRCCLQPQGETLGNCSYIGVQGVKKVLEVRKLC